MTQFVYPGTFDPFTNGHLDIARRAAHLCDKLTVLVMTNYQKNPIFSVEERCEMVRTCLLGACNIEVRSYEGLLVSFLKEVGATACVRGLRSESDFRFEAELAAANKILYPAFESVLLPCRSDLAFTSSSIVREVAMLQGDISGMVPECIQQKVLDKLRALRKK